MSDTFDPAQSPPASREDAFDAGKAAAANRWLLMLVGAVTVLAGLVALLMPFLASITAALIVGWVLIASGVVGLVTAFRRREGWALAASFALSVVAILAGILMLVQPIAGVLALTTVLIGYFAATGVLRVYHGVRAFGSGGGWMIAIGVLSLLLAALLWFELPFSAAWVPGVLLAVDLIVWGAVQIGQGLRLGRMGAA